MEHTFILRFIFCLLSLSFLCSLLTGFGIIAPGEDAPPTVFFSPCIQQVTEAAFPGRFTGGERLSNSFIATMQSRPPFSNEVKGVFE
jgi:hypothetical protein